MPRPDMEAAEIVRRGDEIYNRDIRALVEAEHDGRFLVLDIQSGDDEIGDDELEPTRRSRAKYPDGIRYLLRIGYRAAVSLGGASRRSGS